MEILNKIFRSIDPSSLQLFTVILAFGLLVIGIGADGYRETEDRSSILCLSCLGLNPKTTLEFRFDTANGEDHPDFVKEPLKNNPVFLDYSTDGCKYCDEMRPKIHELKEVFGDEITFIDEINLDHTSSEKEDSFNIYDVEDKDAVPLFVIITLGYDKGIVKPYFASGYGLLNKHSADHAKEVLNDLFKESIELYDQNKG